MNHPTNHSMNHSQTGRMSRRELEELFRTMASLNRIPQLLLEQDSPTGRTTWSFFTNSWENARDGILARTDRMRVVPVGSTSDSPPVCFEFEFDLPYKRKPLQGGVIEWVPGPLRGTIEYRGDLYEPHAVKEPYVVVSLEDRACYHPNHSRSFGITCLGELHKEAPLELQALLVHLYGILSYQNRSSFDSADEEAAAYFALDPDAMVGLEDVPPLY